MNIIFLDVDGVLNSLNYAKEIYKKEGIPHSGYDFPFDPKCLNNLKTLVLETNAYIVITSTWRMHEIGKAILLSELKKYGLEDRVIGYTDVLHLTRGEEIKKYLIDHNIQTNYVILDDDNDFGELENNLIETKFETGLTQDNVNEGIKKLSKKLF